MNMPHAGLLPTWHSVFLLITCCTSHLFSIPVNAPLDIPHSCIHGNCPWTFLNQNKYPLRHSPFTSIIHCIFSFFSIIPRHFPFSPHYPCSPHPPSPNKIKFEKIFKWINNPLNILLSCQLFTWQYPFGSISLEPSSFTLRWNAKKKGCN